MTTFEFEKTSDDPETYSVTHECDECDDAHHMADVFRQSPGVWRITLDEKTLHVRRSGHHVEGDSDPDFIAADTAQQMQEAFTNRYAPSLNNVGVVSGNGMRDYVRAQIDAAYTFAGQTGSIGGVVTALVEGLAAGYMHINGRPTVEDFIAAVTRRLDKEIASAVIVEDMRESLQEAVKEMMQSTGQAAPDAPDSGTPIQ